MSSRHLITAAAAAAVIAGALSGAANANATSDPYNSDGTWLVPSEITPGTYRVALNDSNWGSTRICGDYDCGFGEALDVDTYSGPGVLVIPANAVTVELNNVTLKRMG